MARYIVIILDGAGVGALPDAALFGDEKAFTLKHVLEKTGTSGIPNLIKAGLLNIDGMGMKGENQPESCFGKCGSQSKAKDTTSGHFEIMGLIMEEPYVVFGEKFPDRIIQELERRIGTKTIGNYPASGTEIIKELGDEHCRTGYPIVYLSADSIMQIAMHEEVIPIQRQYEICQIARDLLMGNDAVGRIIARPFAGESGSYYRTERRKDFALDPPEETLLDKLEQRGKAVIGVGKIEDIFNRKGLTEIDHTRNNLEGIQSVIRYLQSDFEGLIFANLVDFDMLYGHRNDPEGFKGALEEFDRSLPEIKELLREEDVLIITADHGCDPTIEGTDHTREYTPLIVIGPRIQKGKNLGIRKSFADIGATIGDAFGIELDKGTSFLKEILIP